MENKVSFKNLIFVDNICVGFFYEKLNFNCGMVLINPDTYDGPLWGAIGDTLLLLGFLFESPRFKLNNACARHTQKVLYKYCSQLYFHQERTPREMFILLKNSNFIECKAKIDPPNLESIHQFLDYVTKSYFDTNPTLGLLSSFI